MSCRLCDVTSRFPHRALTGGFHYAAIITQGDLIKQEVGRILTPWLDGSRHETRVLNLLKTRQMMYNISGSRWLIAR